MPIPFESQFFHDDGDDGFTEDNLDMGTPILDGDGDDLWQGTQGGTSQGLKKSRPDNVKYAKKAKRVDVKRLKDDIWSGLKTLLPEDRPASSRDDSVSISITDVVRHFLRLITDAGSTNYSSTSR